nr:integrase, catalytic region, zinc finger, CCHC-type, peptidase aspartic, catalytic [Tanacetum cinerariifolium]
LKFFGSILDSTELYRHHKASVASCFRVDTSLEGLPITLSSRKGYRIYNKRTRRIMETIHVQFDELTEPMAPVHLSTGPAPNFLMPGQISSGLVRNLAERPSSPAQAVQASVTSAGTPLSTTIDQDAPSPYTSLSCSALQSHSLPPGVVAEPHFMEDHNIDP